MPIELPNFLSKLSPKEFGNHLREYTELYLNPIKSWKKAYSQRKTGFDFTVLHIIYYTILVLIILKDFYLTIQITLLEVLVTLIPLTIFFFPFLICKRLFKIHKKWTKVFRVYLIIKFQFIPIFVLLILITKWSEFETFYILIENGIWLVWIGFIIVVPLINNISLLKKFFWIALNYIFLLLGFFLIGYSLYKLEPNDKFYSKVRFNTPNQEYRYNELKSSLSLYRIYDKGYIAKLEIIDDKSLIIKNVQFATIDLALIIEQNSRNQIIDKQMLLDSILTSRDSTYISNISNHKKDIVIDLNDKVLDSIRKNTDKYFYEDLKLYKKALDSSKFESNKNYFNLYYQYLKHYDSLFVNIEIPQKIISEMTPQSTLLINNKEIIAYYKLSNIFIFDRKDKLIEFKEKLDNRELKSNFLMNLLFYPLEKVLDLTDLY